MVSKSEYYRRRLKQKDPQGYAKYLEKQAVAAKRRRVKLREALSKPKPTKQSLALKEKQRKQARLRQKAYMERKKIQNAKQPCVKVKQEFELPQRPSSSKGASTSTNTETRRAYWCERKQSERLRSKTKATQQEKQSEHGRLRQKTYMEPQKTQNANQPCAEGKLEFELPQPPRSRKGASTSTNPETRRAYWRERKQAQKLREKTKPVKKSPAQQEKQREQGRLRQKAYMERKKRLQVPRSRKAASTSTNTETRRAYWRERKQAERLRLVQSQPEKLRRIREEDRQRKRDKRARDKIKHILKPNTQTLSGFCSSCMTCLIANKPMCQSSCYAGGNFTAKRRNKKGQEKNEDEENNQAVPEVQTTTEVESSTTSLSLSLEAVPPDISGNTQIPEEIKVEQSVQGTSDWYLDKGSPETGEDKMADEDNEESLELVDDEAKKRVLAIGLVCLDIVSVLDHFPIEDTDTRVKDQLWNRGGNASNTSVVLSQLGVCTEYMGTLAKSVLTKLMVDDLTKYGVNMDHCLYHDDCDAPVSCVINNSSTGTRTILHGNRSLPEVMYKDFLLLDLKKYTWIHFEGRNITEVIQMINRVDMYNKELSESQRIKISLELEKPKLEICLEEVLTRVDVVFVSKDFALSHGCKNGEDCVQLFSKKIKQGGQVVCAWGELGAWAIDEANGKVLHSAAYPPSIIKDTLGAGDTFNAGVIHYLSQDRSLLEAITHGCKVAGFKIGNQGFRIQHFTPS